ncbi:hypothetical protein J3R83DRAFT_1483 [Lanmaoa asiatica]|nr:hypothetical protein J3R83DRAFT_1483 [Lanmaoa asiatica]
MDDSKPSALDDVPTSNFASEKDLIDSSPQTDMATLVAPNNPPLLPVVPPAAGVGKRYRPAPAKTFQCRGYGECRMVFSRSEHLARHIRKHTGERPFTCHCSKQFSRLDNLRQHAQTVHADKQEQNERMMRDLTSLHASMAAANKTGQSRGKRGQAPLTVPSPVTTTNASQDPALHHLEHVKEEDINPTSMPMHQRPGTSTGYEAGDSVMYGDSWNTDVDPSNPRPPNNHSFRDSSQSFRVPPASNTSSFYGQQQSQSFLPFSNSLNLGLASRDGRPGSSHSRPPTAGGPDSHARTLPPLAAVVSATIPPPSSQSFPIPPQSTQHILPLPGAAAFRRPATANRPGTAPASYYPKPAYAGGPGLVHHPELSLPIYGRNSELAAAAAATAAAYQHSPFEADPQSPTTGSYDSPFSFHPPALTESSTYGGMRGHVENQSAGYTDLANTNTAQSHALNLDGSPSWNSAMTQMQMAEFDHFYRAQPDQLHGQLPPLDSSHQHLPSHSSIGPHSPATHYSQELSQQQLQQLRQQHLRLEQARRHSVEGDYLQHFGGTLHPHPQQQQSRRHSFLPLTEEPSRLHLYQTHRGAHDPNQPPLPSPPSLDPSPYTQTRHLHPQMHRAHPHYLAEENHNTKYDPPLLQRTPPLRLE